MEKNIRNISVLFLLSLMVSCVPYKSLKILNKEKETNVFDNDEKYLLRIGDILNIELITPTTATNSNMFSLTYDQNSSNPNSASEVMTYLSGYVIDSQGEIELPNIGKIKVLDKTIELITNEISDRMKNYLTFSSIKVRITNCRITALGEVGRPGNMMFLQPNITLLQVLAQFGDITSLGDRSKIKIVRTIKGEKKIMIVNLLDNVVDVQIWPNDIIYVEPLKAKSFRTNSSIISTTISVLTFTLVLIRFVL